MTLTAIQLLEAAGIGLAAGVLGGLAGVGGSMIILPALHLVFGERSDSTHHMYMAAAMTVNAAVSLPAAIRHHRAKAVRVDLLPTLLIGTIVFVAVGVLTGNLFQGDQLRIGLAIFLAVYCIYNISRLLRPGFRLKPEDERTTKPRLLASGAGTGFVGGVLGLGGGVMMVPMLQMLCKIPLRQAIATSSAVICVTAPVGAAIKLFTLSSKHESASDALLLALAMSPTAMLGGVIGAALTHSLDVRIVRVIVTLLLLLAAAKLGGLWG